MPIRSGAGRVGLFKNKLAQIYPTVKAKNGKSQRWFFRKFILHLYLKVRTYFKEIHKPDSVFSSILKWQPFIYATYPQI